jgi:hypothetical protein
MGNYDLECAECNKLKAILEPLSDVPGSTRHLEYIRRCLDEAISKIGPKDGFGYLRKVVNAMIADIKSNDASKDSVKKIARNMDTEENRAFWDSAQKSAERRH